MKKETKTFLIIAAVIAVVLIVKRVKSSEKSEDSGNNEQSDPKYGYGGGYYPVSGGSSSPASGYSVGNLPSYLKVPKSPDVHSLDRTVDPGVFAVAATNPSNTTNEGIRRRGFDRLIRESEGPLSFSESKGINSGIRIR